MSPGSSGRWSISRAAILVTALTAVSTLLGFLRDVVIAAVFGAGPDLDAYLVAQGLMNIVLGLVATAVARSVTPVTARETATEHTEGAEDAACRGHRGFDTALTYTLVILGLAAIVMGVFAGPVTSLIAPGFGGAQADTAVALTRVVLVATVLIAGTNLLAALVQTHGRFAWTALEGVPFNIVMIAAAALFGARYGIAALAVGFVVGSATRLLMQFPPLFTKRIRVRPRWNIRDDSFREIARLVPPMLVGSAVVNINMLVDRAVGSTLEDGAITALSYGWRLIHLPETLIITALLVPLYPALSAVAAQRAEVRRLVRRGLAVTVTALTPICIVLVVAAEPLVSLIFGRGAFDDDAVRATAIALAWYAPALLALGWRQIVVRASYAIGDSRAPVTVAVAAMLINVAGDLVLGPLWGVAGIAIATTVSLVFAAATNLWLLRRRHDGVWLRTAGTLLLRAGLATVPAAGVGWWVAALLAEQPILVVLPVIAAAVLLVYLAALAVLRAPELRELLRLLRSTRG